VVVFQNVFHSEIYQNNIFIIIFKILFSSVHQNDLRIPKKNINLK
jgi:hypothetical protein